MKRFSIIIPVYNSEKTIIEAWNSVYSQLGDNDEIILVNDGSTDNSAKICDELREKDNRTIVIHKENGGVSSARNEGIKQALGKYVLFLDSDDVLVENILPSLWELINKKPADVYITNFCYAYDKKRTEPIIKKQEGYYSKDDAINGIFSNTELTGFAVTKVAKSQLIKTLSFDEEVHMGEDLLFCLQLCLKANTFYFWQQPTYVYNILSTSFSHSYSDKKLSTFKMYEKIESLVDTSKYPFIKQVLSVAKVNFSKYLLEYYYDHDRARYKSMRGQLKSLIKENIKIYNKASSFKARFFLKVLMISPCLAKLIRGRR